VLSLTPTLGSDWQGEPAVFFLVVLSDAASRRDQLVRSTTEVSDLIDQQVQPLERWGVIPYFDFRSQSEQARIDQHSLATFRRKIQFEHESGVCVGATACLQG
jgi:hypothetical protein